MRPWLPALGAAALTVAAAGLVAAQEQPAAPPSDAGAYAPPPAPTSPTDAPAPSANTSGDDLQAAPPDEAAPPPPAPAPTTVAQDPGPPLPPPPPPAPLPRPRFQAVVLQAVDKVTAETLRFEAKVGEAVRYKGLVVTVRACETPAADEPGEDSLGYLEIDSQPVAVPGRASILGRQLYRGWMTAGSPGLNPLQAPGYDVWLIACKTPASVVAPGQA